MGVIGNFFNFPVVSFWVLGQSLLTDPTGKNSSGLPVKDLESLNQDPKRS